MKPFRFIFFSLGFFPFWGMAQNADTLKPSYKFESTVHDFGKIPEGPPATCIFKFINTGNTLLSLVQVQASCGCLKAEWNQNLIAPGQTGEIKATMNTQGRPGNFTKSITAKLSNGSTEYLTLKGFIAAVPDSLRPAFKFEKIIHDFGTIKEGTQAVYEFKYTNTGIVPLIISDVKVPSGCMTPEWSKEPLAPGKAGCIKITFNSSGRIGTFSKTTTVDFVNGGVEFLTIKGNVEPFASVKFDTTVHDFGNIPQNIPATYEFEFKNVGTEPISITDAIGGGHPMLTWNHEPILPNNKGRINARFAAGSPGNFSKSFYVKFSNGDIEYLTVKGYVESPLSIKFDKTIHDFGKIPQNIPVTYEFEFKNVGAEPVSISNAATGGGGFIIRWSSEPIAPGKPGKIEGIYNAAQQGNFTKTATIKFSNGHTEYLTVKGYIEAPAIDPKDPKD